LSELARLRQVSGSRRESVMREAFKDLLKAWGRQQELRVPFGYREAKDEADDLDAEIALKFKRGHPSAP